MPARTFGAISNALKGIPGENRRRETEHRSVCGGNRLFGRIHRFDHDDWPEGFLVGDGGIQRNVSQNRGVINLSVVFRTCVGLGSPRECILYAVINQFYGFN